MWQFHTGFSIRSIFEIMRDSHEALLLQEVDGDVTCSRGDVQEGLILQCTLINNFF